MKVHGNIDLNLNMIKKFAVDVVTELPNDPSIGTWFELDTEKPKSIVESVMPNNGLPSNFNGYVKFTLSENKKLTGISQSTQWYCKIQSIIY